MIELRPNFEEHQRLYLHENLLKNAFKGKENNKLPKTKPMRTKRSKESFPKVFKMLKFLLNNFIIVIKGPSFSELIYLKKREKEGWKYTKRQKINFPLVKVGYTDFWNLYCYSIIIKDPTFITNEVNMSIVTKVISIFEKLPTYFVQIIKKHFFIISLIWNSI